MDNMVALTNLVKIGGTTNQEITNLSKEIWGFCLSKAIAVTAEYLLKSLNIKANHANGCFAEKLFRTFAWSGTAQRGSLASWIFHQVQVYLLWKLDFQSRGTDAFCHTCILYAFPLFSLTRKVLKKLWQETTLWQNQPSYSHILKMCIKNPVLLPIIPKLLQDIQGRCSVKKAFLKFCKYFVWNLPNFKKHLFWRTSGNNCFLQGHSHQLIL